MHLAIRTSLQITHNDGPGRARITLDDGTLIEVQALDGPAPNPSFLIDKIEAKGPSKEAYDEYLASTGPHSAQSGFARVWELYNETLATGGESPIEDWLRTRITDALERNDVVLRLEGDFYTPADNELINIGNRVRVCTVFYAFGGTSLGKVVGIEILSDGPH
jgi:hypothetical protein